MRKATLTLLAVLAITASSHIQPAYSNTPNRTTANITYTTNSGSKYHQLDVYAPKQPGSYPVIVYFHGGAWKFGDRNDIQHRKMAESFAQQGVVFVNCNYRLYPNTDYRGQATDVAQAIAWVKANITQHNGNPNQIFLMGHSAGAHLVSLVGTDERYLQSEGVSLNNIKGVIASDGPYDISAIQQNNPRTFSRIYGSLFGTTPETVKDASPISHVQTNKPLPAFLILHTAHERSTLFAQTFAQALRTVGGIVQLVEAKDNNHASLVMEYHIEGDPEAQRILAFVKRQ
jgi:acetyl esterase/lipase